MRILKITAGIFALILLSILLGASLGEAISAGLLSNYHCCAVVRAAAVLVYHH
jgi:hypothetical protein